MERALTALAAVFLAIAGVLVPATPAMALELELATCLVDNEEIVIDTGDNTATVEYTLDCPFTYGYEGSATAECTGEGSGDRSSSIAGWTSTVDSCVFSNGSGYIGASSIEVNRTIVFAPLLGTSEYVGGGTDVEGLFSPSTQESEVTGNFTTLGDTVTLTNNQTFTSPWVLAET